jgi:uncharacterized protein
MPARRYRVRAYCDVEIPMPDGTRLRADIYRPRVDAPQPVLLGWSPYQKDLMPTGVPAPFNEPGDVRFLAQAGYPVAVVNARGTGRSAGQLQDMLGPAEIDDLCATIAWLAAQPWSDGHVSMIGMSYFAISQLLAAGRRPPGLAAIAPFGAATDLYRMVLTHNGCFHSGFLGRYVALNGAAQRLRLHPEVRHGLGYVVGTRPVQALVRAVMARELPRLTRRLQPPDAWLRRWSRYALDGPFDRPDYHAASPWPYLPDIDVPVLIGSEWSMVGLHLFGAFDAWHHLTAPKRMFIGARTNRWPFGRYQEEILAWYDHVLRGVANGVESLPAVRYWLHGAERWDSASDWPPPDTRSWRLHLSAGSPSTASEAPGALSAPTPAAAAGSQPDLSWAAIPAGMEYPGALDRIERQVLRYVTAPLPAAVHAVGPARLALRLRSTAPDTAVQARLSVLNPSGAATVVSVGWLLASHRSIDETRCTPTEIVHDHSRPVPLAPGQPVLLRFSLTPFAHLIPAGHRLQLELGSNPDRLAAPASEGFVYFPTAGPPYPARNTVMHGTTEPSRLELSVRGAAPW